LTELPKVIQWYKPIKENKMMKEKEQQHKPQFTKWRKGKGQFKRISQNLRKGFFMTRKRGKR
tara:strand:+ start:717 stop:902 length:186 start_codon:yes stop_codon:yes gene_type:complete